MHGTPKPSDVPEYVPWTPTATALTYLMRYATATPATSGTSTSRSVCSFNAVRSSSQQASKSKKVFVNAKPTSSGIPFSEPVSSNVINSSTTPLTVLTLVVFSTFMNVLATREPCGRLKFRSVFLIANSSSMPLVTGTPLPATAKLVLAGILQKNSAPPTVEIKSEKNKATTVPHSVVTVWPLSTGTSTIMPAIGTVSVSRMSLTWFPSLLVTVYARQTLSGTQHKENVS